MSPSVLVSGRRRKAGNQKDRGRRPAARPRLHLHTQENPHLPTTSSLAESYFSGLPLLDSFLPAYFPLPLPLNVPAALLSPRNYLSPDFDYSQYLSKPAPYVPQYSYFDATTPAASMTPITTPPDSLENELFGFDNEAFLLKGIQPGGADGLFQECATIDWDFDGLFEDGWMGNASDVGRASGIRDGGMRAE
ncbi:hypothetical protein P7C70_g9544, partial [Phenoliferia sp. Uapishka_3]